MVSGVTWPVVAQLLGVLAVCVAVGVLAGVWWAVGLGGLILVVGGMLAEFDTAGQAR